jgi:hypothetical protein
MALIEQARGGEVEQQFDAEIQMCLEIVWSDERCQCPNPKDDEFFDPSKADADLRWLQPLPAVDPEGAQAFSHARTAFIKGTATPEQMGVIAHVDRIQGIFGQRIERARQEAQI